MPTPVVSPSTAPIATPGPSSSAVRQLVPVSRKGNTINVKVTQATMKRLPNGKHEFTNTGQAFVDVTESTANVDYITNAIQRRWGSDYQLVTADGLQLEDSSGTQGKSYELWIT